ncbi:MAG: hypothetical protein E7439_05635 [Ruminococcaceae bacterium]|nr:hypothetical protein [Oscillospiraceae bacterium]
MDESIQRQPNPRRRRKTRMQIFKEAYLPTIIFGIAVVLILVFIIGALSRGSSPEADPSPENTAPTENPVYVQQAQQVQQLLAQAKALADDYQFQEAVALLDSFAGDKSVFPELAYKRGEYAQQASQMVVWSDPGKITNLSFHSLIVDLDRALANTSYGTSYNKNFVTTSEFTKILEQLYANGYVLVSLDDITTCTTDAVGNTTCQARTLYLPLGKKPLLLTQTNVNYYTYMIDGDEDGVIDKGNGGFASKLVVKADGSITCEMVDANGGTVTGDFDLVPILERFIAEHPDFSYKGARAILAVTGYDGIFGYRINSSVKDTKGEAYYAQQVFGAKKLVEALRQKGYELACYTYYNWAYGKISAQEIQSDLKAWNTEIAPILGDTNILAFAQSSDIGSYSGTKFNLLQSAGFRYYLDFGDGRSGSQIGSNFISHQRLLVTGSTMTHSASLFAGMFDPASILESRRGSVPR